MKLSLLLLCLFWYEYLFWPRNDMGFLMFVIVSSSLTLNSFIPLKKIVNLSSVARLHGAHAQSPLRSLTWQISRGNVGSPGWASSNSCGSTAHSVQLTIKIPDESWANLEPLNFNALQNTEKLKKMSGNKLLLEPYYNLGPNYSVTPQVLMKIHKLRGLSPRANYTDRATAACQRI
jgi:hypothetical protein